MTDLWISGRVSIPESELEFNAIRAPGPGGQNVNKLATAVHLRFDIARSSLPDFYKQRLLARSDSRITQSGVVVIKANEYRSQEKNRLAAKARLVELIQQAAEVQKARRPTKPSRSSQKRRLEQKTRRGRIKSLRGRVKD